MASYNSFYDPSALPEILVPTDEITGNRGQTTRDIAEEYVHKSKNLPELIRNLKKAEQIEKDRDVTQVILHVRMRAENLLGDLVENQ